MKRRINDLVSTVVLLCATTISTLGTINGIEDNATRGGLIEPNSLSLRSPYITHDSRDAHLSSLLDHDLKYCQRPAKCQVLNHTTCMGTKLPYHSSTLELTDLTTQEQAQEKLALYKYLKYVPKCWAVIQPFLCALYTPKCENDMVDLPSREMCKITLGPCKILYNSTIFPEFMKCDDSRLFPSRCKNHIHELKFNTTGFCLDPLVKTDHEEWFYPDVDGCGLRCKDALYTDNEQYQIHKLVGYCILICVALNLFTVMTFVIDWKTANKYPALAIFYVNLCFLISYTGWMIQFLGYDTRDDVVCKKDGTRRMSEPCASENLSCVTVFVMVYYFLIAGLVWFVIFTYSWYMNSLNALGKIRKRIDKKRAYFHLVAWSVPLILTITTMALGEIDGDYVSGICFVGFVHFGARAGLLLAPLFLAVILAGFVITRGLILLIGVRRKGREIIPKKNSRKIHSNIVRMGVFALFMLCFCVITFFYHGYRHVHIHIWERSLYNYIVCKLSSLSSDFSHCRQEARPSVAMLQLQLLAVFGCGVAMASWVWCKATINAWTRYIRFKLDCEEKCPLKLQEHRVIREVFACRKKFNAFGQLSLVRHHTDPVDLAFSINAVDSHELSTSWAANLGRLLERRNGLPKLLDTATDSASGHSVSVDSEMSYQVQHVSIESRRNSGDSQLSVQVSKFMLNSRKRRRGKHGYKHKRNHQRHTTSSTHRSTNIPTRNGRGSSTSLDSHFRQQVKQIILSATTTTTAAAATPAATAPAGCTGACEHAGGGGVKRLLGMRRPGDAGLAEDSPRSIQYMLRDLCVGVGDTGREGDSDEENVESVTISESRFNVTINNNSTLPQHQQYNRNHTCVNAEQANKLRERIEGGGMQVDRDDESDRLHIEELNSDGGYVASEEDRPHGPKSSDNNHGNDDSVREIDDIEVPIVDEYALAKSAVNGNKRRRRKQMQQQQKKKLPCSRSNNYNITDDDDEDDYNNYVMSDSDSTSSSSCCQELKQLLVHSSVNSGNSCPEKHNNNRGSKQSKTSIDVAVQANAKDILTQTGNYEVIADGTVHDDTRESPNNGASSGWSATKRSSDEQRGSRDWNVKSKRSKDGGKKCNKEAFHEDNNEANLNGKSIKGDTENLLTKDKYKTKIAKQNGKGFY